MTMYEAIYKTGPFFCFALVLIGWALIELFRTRIRNHDLITWTIAWCGIAGGIYILSLALNYSPVGISWWPWWFDAIRISLWMTLPGIPAIWINVFRAARDRRNGIFREV